MDTNVDKEKENQVASDEPSEKNNRPIEASLNPCCSSCSITESIVWCKDKDNNVLCKLCSKAKNLKGRKKGKALKESGSNHTRSEEVDSRNKGDTNAESSKTDEKVNCDNETSGRTNTEVRKSTRKSRFKQANQGKSNSSKSKGRRNIFKKCVYKSPSSVITPITCDAVYYNGFFYQSGDVVELTDFMGSVYYAQLRGFLQDQYCEKSAVITWLLPTKASPKDYFDPTTYILGPEEDIPRKLDCMKFVCNCPSDYFKALEYPVGAPACSAREGGFIWTRLGPSTAQKT
ncbi:GATA zinc finger domain-containing protein 1 [Tetranychus urticae]|nr:GATA zinc finger domain-containing protein 1 [Tetranychus urticae]